MPSNILPLYKASTWLWRLSQVYFSVYNFNVCFTRLENLIYQNNSFIIYTKGQSSIQHITLNQLNITITKQIFLNIYYFPSILALLKYQNPFIEYAIFESCLSCNFLLWTQNFSTIHQWAVSFNTIPCSSKVCLRITSPWLFFKYWSGPVKYCPNYVSMN